MLQHAAALNSAYARGTHPSSSAPPAAFLPPADFPSPPDTSPLHQPSLHLDIEQEAAPTPGLTFAGAAVRTGRDPSRHSSHGGGASRHGSRRGEASGGGGGGGSTGGNNGNSGGGGNKHNGGGGDRASGDNGAADGNEEEEEEGIGEYEPSESEEDGFSGYGGSTATGSEAGGETLGYQEPEDTEPLRRFVMRTSSFSREDFDELLRAPGMYAVKDHMLQESQSLGRGRTARLCAPAGRLAQQHTGVRARRPRRRRQKSVFGLPTVRPDNHWYVAWSTLILVLDLTYSAFVVPISIGMMTSFYTANWTTIFDFTAGALFFSDLLINFHVGFIATYNMHKVLVLNGRLIAKFYITKGSFLSDSTSSMAWVAQIVLLALYYSIHAFDPHTILYVMEGIRLLRFLRVIRLIKQLLSSCIYASISFEAKFRLLRFLKNQNLMYLLYIIYIIFVLVNFIGCLWNFVAAVGNFDNTWVNYYWPFVRDYAADPSVGFLTPDEARDVDDVWRYFTGCYWGMTTIAGVGYGDITPSNLGETLVVLLVEIVGVMFFALLLTTVSELLQQVNRNARRLHAYRSKMEAVEIWMAQFGIPRRLRRRIKTFYAEVWLRQSENREETQLFLELPHVLRNEVSWHVCHNVFRLVPMLQEIDDSTLYLIASKMTPYRFGPGTDLCTEGDAANRLFILLEGEVAALYHFHEAEHVEGPAVVGDTVLLQELEPHFSIFPCTYRTVTNCTVWMLAWRDLKMLLAFRPELQSSLALHVRQQLQERQREFPHLWRDSLKRKLSGTDISLPCTPLSPLSPTAAGEDQGFAAEGHGAEGTALRRWSAAGSDVGGALGSREVSLSRQLEEDAMRALNPAEAAAAAAVAAVDAARAEAAAVAAAAAAAAKAAADAAGAAATSPKPRAAAEAAAAVGTAADAAAAVAAQHKGVAPLQPIEEEGQQPAQQQRGQQAQQGQEHGEEDELLTQFSFGYQLHSNGQEFRAAAGTAAAAATAAAATAAAAAAGAESAGAGGEAGQGAAPAAEAEPEAPPRHRPVFGRSPRILHSGAMVIPGQKGQKGAPSLSRCSTGGGSSASGASGQPGSPPQPQPQPPQQQGLPPSRALSLARVSGASASEQRQQPGAAPAGAPGASGPPSLARSSGSSAAHSLARISPGGPLSWDAAAAGSAAPSLGVVHPYESAPSLRRPSSLAEPAEPRITEVMTPLLEELQIVRQQLQRLFSAGGTYRGPSAANQQGSGAS